MPLRIPFKWPSCKRIGGWSGAFLVALCMLVLRPSRKELNRMHPRLSTIIGSGRGRRWLPRAARVLPIVGLTAVAQCHPQSRTAVIGFAYGLPTPNAADVAEDAIRMLPPADGIEFRITVATAKLAGFPGNIEHARRLAALPGVVGVVGHAGSRESIVSARIYNEAGIPQIVPTGTSRWLRRAGPWTFMLAPDDSAEGAFIGRFVAERLRASAVTIFYNDDEYGIGLRDGAAAELRARGIAVVDRVPISSVACRGQEPEAGVRAVVDASLRRARPDAVIIAARSYETGCVARQVSQHLPTVPLVAGDGVEIGEPLLARAGRAVASLHVVAFWHPDVSDSVSRDFVTRFRQAAGRSPQPSDALIFDGVMLLAQAGREVGPDRERIRRYLESLGVSRPPYRGVTGPISFAAMRTRPLYMRRMQGGTPIPVPAR